MGKDNSDKGRSSYNLKYFFVSFFLFFIVSILVLFIIEKEFREVRFKEIKESEERIVAFEEDFLSEELNRIIADLNYLHHGFESELKNASNYDSIAQNWSVFSTQRNIYDQIRFINNDGDEKIRINLNDNGGYIVPNEELQNKKDIYYFYETVLLGKNLIHVSPLDLNIENGVIEEPHKPMIRFSTPVYGDNGKIKGTIVLSYLAERILDNFKMMALISKGEIMLLNSNGSWIVSNNPELEFLFMFDNDENNNFKNTYKEEWNKIIRGNGQIISPNGLFTYTTVHFDNIIKNDKADNDQNIYLKDGRWHIVSLVAKEGDNYSLFIDNNMLLLLDVIKKNLLYFFMVLVISCIGAFWVYTNKKIYLSIKYFSEFDAVTKVYNRRAGLLKLNNLIPLDERREFLFSICYIDVNGLKLVNDNLGHNYGDELLVILIDIIKSIIRKEDFIIRLGGDEFLIVFVDIDLDTTEEVWSRIVSIYEEVNKNENRPYLISVSHGVVSANRDLIFHIDDLIKMADERMYEEKRDIKEELKVIK